MASIPKLQNFQKYPVITGTSLLAIVLSVAFWSKADISLLFATVQIRRGELWRLVTAVLLHADIFHLAFNLYWLWKLGRYIEQAFGHRNTAFLLLLFAIGSCSLQFAFSSGGIGLSGVIYGLFGMLWILSRRDDRFRKSIDNGTLILFLAWFVICIAMSSANMTMLAAVQGSITLIIAGLVGTVVFFPNLGKRYGNTVVQIFLLTVFAITASIKGERIGNIAHGTGLALGVLVGFAISTTTWPKIARASVIGMVLVSILGATLGRPLLNHSEHAGYEEAKWCYDALTAELNEKAIWWCRDAVIYHMDNYDNLINLAIAYDRAGDKARARFVLHQAYEVDPERFNVESKNKEQP